MSPSQRSEPRSPAYRSFLHDLERVAASEATVLLTGESGSGKGHAARLLHEASPRAAGPLAVVQIAALPASLVEAELFGHAEGAFTGAERERAGRVRAADGGTLVLDGIELLPLEQQVKLLRVLQERVVEPLGGDPQPVDVRVIATSTARLASQVEAGAFREDLYYRLAVVTLEVPALRQRLEDLEPLVEVLSEQVAQRSRVPARPASKACLERLAAHPWPGNLRELENALERVHVLGSGAAEEAPEMTAEEFEFLGEALEDEDRRLAKEALALGLDLDRLTHALLEAALEEQRGNVSAAARQVGLSRRAFEYRRKRTDSEQDA